MLDILLKSAGGLRHKRAVVLLSVSLPSQRSIGWSFIFALNSVVQALYIHFSECAARLGQMRQRLALCVLRPRP
ncbi:hypothetical protein Nepgr_005781 [Nepenthes gracilis]|uniref:Uncharacterized protein n=1 Tax=Nepenthes gracilis TaxID=150966 RepID=A0AAD3XGS0_NEPGR|nr:hypothetical protein Nepgr_005781 [Nepenthes gracilis]